MSRCEIERVKYRVTVHVVHECCSLESVLSSGVMMSNSLGFLPFSRHVALGLSVLLSARRTSTKDFYACGAHVQIPSD